jgi:hypothetical protein
MRAIAMKSPHTQKKINFKYHFTDNIIPLQKPLKNIAISTQDVKESIDKTNDVLTNKISNIEQELSELTIAVNNLTKILEKKSILNSLF